MTNNVTAATTPTSKLDEMRETLLQFPIYRLRNAKVTMGQNVDLYPNPPEPVGQKVTLEYTNWFGRRTTKTIFIEWSEDRSSQIEAFNCAQKILNIVSSI